MRTQARGALALAGAVLVAFTGACGSSGTSQRRTPAAAACTSAAIAKGLAAGGGLSQPAWRVQSYACRAGWAIAAVVAPSIHPPLYAILRRQSGSWASQHAVDAVCFTRKASAQSSFCPGYVLPPPAVLHILVGKIGPLQSGAA